MLGSHKQKAIRTRGLGLLMCSKPTGCTHKMKQEELVHKSIAHMKSEQGTEAKPYELEPTCDMI
jgi:hypothetical protein